MSIWTRIMKKKYRLDKTLGLMSNIPGVEYHGINSKQLPTYGNNRILLVLAFKVPVSDLFRINPEMYAELYNCRTYHEVHIFTAPRDSLRKAIGVASENPNIDVSGT